MPKNLTRLIALFLVFSLIAEPINATAASLRPWQGVAPSTHFQTQLNQAALATNPLTQRHFLQHVPYFAGMLVITTPKTASLSLLTKILMTVAIGMAMHLQNKSPLREIFLRRRIEQAGSAMRRDPKDVQEIIQKLIQANALETHVDAVISILQQPELTNRQLKKRLEQRFPKIFGEKLFFEESVHSPEKRVASPLPANASRGHILREIQEQFKSEFPALRNRLLREKKTFLPLAARAFLRVDRLTSLAYLTTDELCLLTQLSPTTLQESLSILRDHEVIQMIYKPVTRRGHPHTAEHWAIKNRGLLKIVVEEDRFSIRNHPSGTHPKESMKRFAKLTPILAIGFASMFGFTALPNATLGLAGVVWLAGAVTISGLIAYSILVAIGMAMGAKPNPPSKGTTLKEFAERYKTELEAYSKENLTHDLMAKALSHKENLSFTSGQIGTMLSHLGKKRYKPRSNSEVKALESSQAARNYSIDELIKLQGEPTTVMLGKNRCYITRVELLSIEQPATRNANGRPQAKMTLQGYKIHYLYLQSGAMTNGSTFIPEGKESLFTVFTGSENDLPSQELRYIDQRLEAQPPVTLGPFRWQHGFFLVPITLSVTAIALFFPWFFNHLPALGGAMLYTLVVLGMAHEFTSYFHQKRMQWNRAMKINYHLRFIIFWMLDDFTKSRLISIYSSSIVRDRSHHLVFTKQEVEDVLSKLYLQSDAPPRGRAPREVIIDNVFINLVRNVPSVETQHARFMEALELMPATAREAVNIRHGLSTNAFDPSFNAPLMRATEREILRSLGFQKLPPLESGIALTSIILAAIIGMGAMYFGGKTLFGNSYSQLLGGYGLIAALGMAVNGNGNGLPRQIHRIIHQSYLIPRRWFASNVLYDLNVRGSTIITPLERSKREKLKQLYMFWWLSQNPGQLLSPSIQKMIENLVSLYCTQGVILIASECLLKSYSHTEQTYAHEKRHIALMQLSPSERDRLQWFWHSVRRMHPHTNAERKLQSLAQNISQVKTHAIPYMEGAVEFSKTQRMLHRLQTVLSKSRRVSKWRDNFSETLEILKALHREGELTEAERKALQTRRRLLRAAQGLVVISTLGLCPSHPQRSFKPLHAA